MTPATVTERHSEQTTDKTAIRPFRVNVPEAELTELRRRINATKWPERETVTDQSQGVQLATIQKLARYWATDYDWRKVLPVAGPAARNVSPRVGHLHVTVDDLPWLWADFGQSNTIVLVGMPRGQHKVLIELVDPEGNVFTGQTVTFTAPGMEKLAQ